MALDQAVPDRSATRETLEDYTLRFAPRGFRRWSPMVVGASALGGMAYMADFSIGAGIGLSHGTSNALLAILVGGRDPRDRVPAGLLRFLDHKPGVSTAEVMLGAGVCLSL